MPVTTYDFLASLPEPTPEELASMPEPDDFDIWDLYYNDELMEE